MLWQQPASKTLGSGQQKAGNVSGAKKKRKKKHLEENFVTN